MWTTAFSPESNFVGDWSEGSEIRFLESKYQETANGMISVIAANRPNEFVSIKHIGVIHNGVEDTTSEEAKSWAPAYENYTLIERDNGTELQIDMDVQEEHKAMFDEMWPKALQKLKELAEK